MVEAAIGRERGVERLLAGVAERAVPEIVGQRHGFGEILVEGQRPGRGACDLGHLEGVGQTGAEVVALVIDEHLGLVLQTAKGGAVDDPVAVALEGAAQRALGLGIAATAAALRVAGVRRQRPAGGALAAETAV